MPELTDVVTAEALAQGITIGVTFELGEVNLAAMEWARRYSYELVTQLTDTTRKVVSEATRQFIETPGMTQGQLRNLLKPAFGEPRATMIATTEVTRANAQGVRIYQQMLANAGIEMVRIWNTATDEKVCPICGPLEGKPESEWGDQAEGPPAHVNCRCWTTLTAMPERAVEERPQYRGEREGEAIWEKT